MKQTPTKKIEAFNTLLESLTTYEEFEHFMALLKLFDLTLYTKRRRLRAFSFCQVKDLNRVAYLIDDQYSKGWCNVSNLYRYLEVDYV